MSNRTIVKAASITMAGVAVEVPAGVRYQGIRIEGSYMALRFMDEDTGNYCDRYFTSDGKEVAREIGTIVKVPEVRLTLWQKIKRFFGGHPRY